MRLQLAAIAFAIALLPGLPAQAEWSWLRSENSHVNEGNKKLAGGDAKGALEAYDQAARQLPSEGGVHLDRGLALLKQGDLAKARDALKLGAQSRATPAVRADAHYDLGVSFYKEADAAAGKDDHEQAQKLFRESADAFKQALRLRPGDRAAAWNYELAARRIREQQEKQKQKDDQNKQKQDQDKKDQDKKDQDQQKQDGNQDQQKQDQDQQKPDQAKQDQDQQKQDQQKPDADKQKQDEQKQPDPQQAQQQPQPRPEAERALDALQDGEENLERIKALQRAARERREPEKDW